MSDYISLLPDTFDAPPEAFDGELLDLFAPEQEPVSAPLWQPHPDNKPQQTAYACNAKWLGYGGAAGGGKSDFLIGSFVTQHHTSVIYRRESTQIKDIRARAKEIINDNGAGLNKVDGTYSHSDGKLLNFAHIQYEEDKVKYKGRARDGIGFDEVTEFTRSQVQYVTTWNRTTIEGQKCQIVFTFNPPDTAEGEWVIDFFAPWLDEDYDGYGGKAESGEIRWAYVKQDANNEFVDVWVDGPGPHWDEEKQTHYTADSRCFVAARVEDNPFMMATGYDKTLDALPDALRDAMRYGLIRRNIKDSALQVIPREWVKAAQKRWEDFHAAGGKIETPLTALGVDVARGGKDSTVIFKRYGNYFPYPKSHQGVDTDDGPKAAALILQELEPGGAAINLDIINVGTSVYDSLKADYENTHGVNGSAATSKTDKTGLLKMRNLRAELWWNLREALDPFEGEGLMLPPDNGLLKDLTSAQYKKGVSGLQIEDKKEIKKRIGRSPDRAEALMYALYTPAPTPTLPALTGTMSNY